LIDGQVRKPQVYLESFGGLSMQNQQPLLYERMDEDDYRPVFRKANGGNRADGVRASVAREVRVVQWIARPPCERAPSSSILTHAGLLVLRVRRLQHGGDGDAASVSQPLQVPAHARRPPAHRRAAPGDLSLQWRPGAEEVSVVVVVSMSARYKYHTPSSTVMWTHNDHITTCRPFTRADLVKQQVD